MKKVLPLIIFCSALLFPQQSNFLQLQNDIKIIKQESINIATNEPVKKKNTGLAIFYSLLLPGMGELYAEGYSSGKYFTIAEGALWLSYIGVSTYGSWQEERYKSFAESNGGVNAAGKNSDYYARISEYFNIDEYNDEQALNRNFDMMYSDEYYWNWNNPDDRKTYRNMWISSEQSYNNLKFIVGGMILNRLISAINAVRVTSAYNKRIQEQAWNLSLAYSPDISNPGFRLNFIASF